jgi:Flp pilus assembly protein TadG
MAMDSGSFLPFFRRLVGCERGDPIIEFIFIVPLMLVLCFGVIEIGRVLWYQHFITKGVRDGTRYLTRVPLDGGAGTCGAVISGAESYAKGLVLSGAHWVTAKSTDLTVTLDQVPNSGAFYGPNPLCMVRMTAVVEINFPILDAFLKTGPSVTFGISNQARHIGL